MQNARGGYTIVEVLIVLVVSLVVFFAAVTVFSGKQGKTEFAQAMRDVESQIQAAINDVRVSTYPDASNYICAIDPLSQRPRLTSGTSGTGTNTACIFLGKAIHLIPNTGSTPDGLKVYTVLGNRTKIGSNEAITNFDEVNAEPIMGLGGNPDLTESYNIIFGIRTLSAREDSSSGQDTYLMGFYNSLHSTASAAEGSQTLKTIGYVGVRNYSAPGQVQTSIRGVGPAIEANSKIWTICFQSGTSNETAQLIVNSSFSGATTQVKYTSCS